MNDKLKQSLQGRLSGMRWGEREQEEVFRQIQRKEMQEVKHVRRSTGILALAAAMLFFIIGAALAVTGTGQPEDTTSLAQPTENTFIPVPAAHCENDYITLTVDDASWRGEELIIDLTLRLKEPDKHALVIGPYSNPGSAGRRMLTTTLEGECETSQISGTRMITVISEVEVLDMTTDSATLRLTHSSLEPDARETLDVSLTIRAESDEPVFTETVDFSIRKQDIEPASTQRIRLFENELITGYLVSSRTEGEFLHYTVDVEPVKPWYVINTTAPNKSRLTVTAEWFIGYDEDDVLSGGSVYSSEYTATSEGTRTTTLLAFPSEHQTIRFMCRESTWVVSFDARKPSISDALTLTMEETTGDVLMAFTCYDPLNTGRRTPSSDQPVDYGLYLDFNFTVTNELTWETESRPLKVTLPFCNDNAYQPLHLLSSTDEDSFVQAGFITSDRYHYIGVMKAYDNFYAGIVVKDAEGNILGTTDSSLAVTNLATFPRLLVPYDGDDASLFTVSVVRIDKSVPMPEVLHVEYSSSHTTALPSFVLTADPDALPQSAPPDSSTD